MLECYELLLLGCSLPQVMASQDEVKAKHMMACLTQHTGDVGNHGQEQEQYNSMLA